VTDVEAPSMPRTRRQAKREERLARARRGGRGWERPHKHASRQRMSMTARLTIVLLLLIVAGGVGYYVWQDWDNVSDFVTTLFTGEGAQVEAVAEEEIDPITGEPVVFAEPVAYYYDEPTGGEVSAKHGGTIAWALVDDALLGPVIAAHIDVPDRGLTFDVTFSTSANAAASHEVSVLTTATGNAEALRGVDNIAVKTSEESIGLELDGTVASAPGRYLLELPADAARLNANRFATSPWFDIALVFESGERAVVAFSKGTVGARLFRDAMAVWDGTAAAVP
jgi:hypothetical protein